MEKMTIFLVNVPDKVMEQCCCDLNIYWYMYTQTMVFQWWYQEEVTGTHVTRYNGRHTSLSLVLIYIWYGSNLGSQAAERKMYSMWWTINQNLINRDVLCVLSGETAHDYHVIRYTIYIRVCGRRIMETV